MWVVPPSVGPDNCGQRGRRSPAGTEIRPMPSLGIVSLINRLIVTFLAGLGSATIEWLPPVDGIDGADYI
jgi:hypothetical protein